MHYDNLQVAMYHTLVILKIVIYRYWEKLQISLTLQCKLVINQTIISIEFIFFSINNYYKFSKIIVILIF